jgi:hypothetical protein
MGFPTTPGEYSGVRDIPRKPSESFELFQQWLVKCLNSTSAPIPLLVVLYCIGGTLSSQFAYLAMLHHSPCCPHMNRLSSQS